MTLAECKRRLQLGTVVRMTYHRNQEIWKPERWAQAAAGRAVSKVQTNAVCFDGSYLWWPKASLFRSGTPDTFTILDDLDGQPLMSYQIMPAAEVSHAS